MTYVVKRIDEQMYGCEEPAPGAEVLVDVTLVAPDGVKRVLPYPALLCGFNQIPEALRLLDQFIQNRNIIITALLRHLSDAALIAG